MATVLSENFESLTAGTNITASNTAFTAFVSTSTVPTVQSSPTPPSGSRIAQFLTTTSTTCYADGPLSGGAKSLVFGRYAFRCAALPTANSLISAFLTSGDSTESGDVQLRTDGSLVVRNSSLTAAINSSTSTNLASGGAAVTLSANTWYVIQHQIDVTNGKARLWIWSVTGTLLFDSGLVTSTQANTCTNFRVGIMSGAQNTYFADAVVVDDAASVGPITSGPTGFTRFQYNGTSWVPYETFRV